MSCAGITPITLPRKVPRVACSRVSKYKQFVAPLSRLVPHVLLRTDPSLWRNNSLINANVLRRLEMSLADCHNVGVQGFYFEETIVIWSGVFFAIIVLIFFWVAEVQWPENCFKPVMGHLLVREVKVIWPLFPPIVFSVVDMHKASEDNDAQKHVEVFHCLSLPRQLSASFNCPSCIGIGVVNNCPDNRCTKNNWKSARGVHFIFHLFWNAIAGSHIMAGALFTRTNKGQHQSDDITMNSTNNTSVNIFISTTEIMHLESEWSSCIRLLSSDDESSRATFAPLSKNINAIASSLLYLPLSLDILSKKIKEIKAAEQLSPYVLCVNSSGLSPASSASLFVMSFQYNRAPWSMKPCWNHKSQKNQVLHIFFFCFSKQLLFFVMFGCWIIETWP